MARHGKSDYYKQNKRSVARKLRIDTSGKETGASKGRRFVLWAGITAVIALFVVVGTASLGSIIAPPNQAVLLSDSHAIDVFSSNGSKIPFALVSSTSEYATSSNITYILTNVTMGEMAQNNVGKISVNLSAGASYASVSATPIAILPDSTVGATYNVTFTEHNLTLPHYDWSVNITNSTGVSQLHTTNASSQTVALLNGTYSYVATTTESDFATLASSYSFTVKGAKLALDVNYSQKFTTTFNEKGLLTAKEWSILTSNGLSSSAATGRVIDLSFFNGSYSYQADTNETGVAALPGTFAIAGTNLSINVTFSNGYNVTFHETGLPANTPWHLNLTVNGVPESTTSKIAANISIYLLNATYKYTGSGTNGTTHDLYMTAFGNFTVKGVGLNVNLTFARAYTVTFIEKGLPSGTSWYVVLGTGQVLASAPLKLNNTTVLAVSGPAVEGNYTYTPRISTAGYAASPGKFDLTENMTVYVNFTAVLPPPPLIKATITIGFGTSVSNFVPVVSNVTNISYAMLLIQPYYLTGNQSDHLMIEVNNTAPGLKYVTFELLGNTGPFSSFGPIHAEDFGYVVGGTIILALTFVTVPWIAIYREQWVMSERKVN